MSFAPVLPLGGYAGWRFLQRTLPAQSQSFAESRPTANLTEHFRAEISKVGSVDDLMADRRLLRVSLEAFGLGDDIDAKAFIRQVLNDGTLDPDALAGRLTDKRYRALSRSFGFGDLGARTSLPGFADEIIARFESRSFETAVGEQDNAMRLALNVEPAIEELLEETSSDRARWFAVMGNPPLRSVFEGALGLPASFGRIDLDQQLDQFRSRASSVFGTDSFEAFADPEVQEKLVRLFLVREQAASFQAASGGSIALMLLQGGGA